ncbi:MAG: hypothetical protein ACOY5F_01575 [Pseudomonadota bacterium]|jgi:hypothetical protein
MDTSFTVKPRDNTARTAVGRSNVVRTELAPSQSVNAAEQSSTSHQSSGATMRDPSLDPQCQAVLDRERDERQRRRARKDEIMQRQKAYGRSAEKPDPVQDNAPHADIQV